MRIRQLAPVLALLSLGATGCSARDEPAPLANAAPALAARLLADTGVAWTVYGTTGGGRSEPEVLGPERPVQIPGATRQDQAKGFFAKYADALPQLSGVQLGAARTEDDADGSGVVKIGYLVPGTKLTVFDAFAAMHFDPGGGVRYLSIRQSSLSRRSPSASEAILSRPRPMTVAPGGPPDDLPV